jgi:hypothetical protein
LTATGDTTRLIFVNTGYAGDQTGSVAQHEAGWLGALAELRRIHELGPAWYPLTTEYDLTPHESD